jgi:hypothetical protein
MQAINPPIDRMGGSRQLHIRWVLAVFRYQKDVRPAGRCPSGAIGVHLRRFYCATASNTTKEIKGHQRCQTHAGHPSGTFIPPEISGGVAAGPAADGSAK